MFVRQATTPAAPNFLIQPPQHPGADALSLELWRDLHAAQSEELPLLTESADPNDLLLALCQCDKV